MILGIDVGGTHLDGVIINKKKVLKTVKIPVKADNLFSTIYEGILSLTKDINKSEIKRINLSTTITTNAIVENKLEKVLVLIQSGPGIKNDFSKNIKYIKYLDGYVDHRGKVAKDFKLDSLEKLNVPKNLKYLSVVTKFSTRNPVTENKIYNYLKDDFKFITLGHRISGNLNFPRRVYTSYLNSAVEKTFRGFALNIKKSLEKENINAPIYILKADGGTLPIDLALKRPVETVLSGPSASFMGISALENTKEDSIYLDIGGTTTDIFFLVDGKALFYNKGLRIKDLNTLVRGIYSASIGLGGDSLLKIDDENLSIGPERLDRPLGLGGKFPTVTDALIVLDLLKIGHKEKSKKGLIDLLNSANLEMDIINFCRFIIDTFIEILYKRVYELLDEINKKPLYTVKEVLENRQINPKEIKIIGGPGKVLAPFIEEKFKIKTTVPKYYKIANAIGAALSKPTMEANLIGDTKTKRLNVPEFSIYENIDSSFNQQKGEEFLKKLLLNNVNTEFENEVEIIESESFNTVDLYEFYKNIRIKGQVKPGLIFNIWGDKDES